MILRAPVLLAEHHTTESFDCGVASLNEWLIRRARANQEAGASRTYVVSDSARVVAYYALASSSIASEETSGRFRRNMPNPVPVIMLARLAIDRSLQGQGMGYDLVQDAARRVIVAADIIGVRGLIVHAISDDATAFYIKCGFEPSPTSPMTLMISLQDLKAAL